MTIIIDRESEKKQICEFNNFSMKKKSATANMSKKQRYVYNRNNMKSIGSEIYCDYFATQDWEDTCEKLLWRATLYKFLQNKTLLKQLLQTNDRRIYELGTDRVWSCGVSVDKFRDILAQQNSRYTYYKKSKTAYDSWFWTRMRYSGYGSNKMGRILTSIRQHFQNQYEWHGIIVIE